MTPAPAGALVERLATYFERGGLDRVQARQAAVDLFADPEALAQLGRNLVELAQRVDAPYPVDMRARREPEAT